MAHLIPLMVTDVDGTVRVATEAELERYEATSKSAHSKWVTANRIAWARRLLSTGTAHGAAWSDAFQRYPAPETTQQKHRFTMQL